VGQGIHTGGGGQARRHADHEDRVVDGDARGDAPVGDGHLHVAGGVGDDGEAGHFRAGAGGGVDGEVGHQRLGGLVDAFVVVDLAAVGHDEANALAAVVGRAAAQGDEAVAAVFLVDLHAVVDVFVRGIGHGLVIEDVGHVRGVEQVRDLFADAHGHDTLVGDEQGLAAAQGADLFGNLLGSADADQGDAGDEKAVDHFLNRHDVLRWLEILFLQ